MVRVYVKTKHSPHLFHPIEQLARKMDGIVLKKDNCFSRNEYLEIGFLTYFRATRFVKQAVAKKWIKVKVDIRAVKLKWNYVWGRNDIHHTEIPITAYAEKRKYTWQPYPPKGMADWNDTN